MADSGSTVPFDVGDSVRVNEGVEDSDYPGQEISGWQGRVVGVQDEDPPLLEIEWDSVTLNEMPTSILEEAELDGFDWTRYHLYASDVEAVEPRDAPQDVKHAQTTLREELRWVFVEEDEEQLIRQVLSQAESDDERAVLTVWKEKLTDRLSFPFGARVAEPQESGPFQYGEKVHVKNILLMDSLYGLLAVIQQGRSTKHLPLADLEAVDGDSNNYESLRAYRAWFANR